LILVPILLATFYVGQTFINSPKRFKKIKNDENKFPKRKYFPMTFIQTSAADEQAPEETALRCVTQ